MSKSFKSIAVVSLSTGGSRVLGFVRDVLMFAALGASVWNSAFILAFTLPNLFRRLLGEGAMTSAMIPVFSEVLVRDGKAGAFRFFSQVFFRLLLALLILAALVMLLMGGLVKAGFLPPNWSLAGELAVLLFPYVLFICLAAIVTAGLNVLGRFAAAASTPMLLNLSIIASLGGGMLLGKEVADLVYWLCGGVLLGGVLQLAVPALDLARQGWRPRIEKSNTADLNELWRLLLPGLAGAAILQVNIMISRVLAHSLDEEAVSILYLGSRLMELPLGLFTMAVITVFFPLLARAVAAQDEMAFANALTSGMRLVIGISFPAGVGLIVLGQPIVEITRFGAFSEASALNTVPLVAIYGFGLPFYSAATFATRGLHAGKAMRVTVWVAAVALLVNLIFGLILMQFWGARGLASANVIAAMVQACLLWHALSSERAEVSVRRMLPAFAKIGIAGLAMGVICYGGLALIAGLELSLKLHAIVSVSLLVPGGVFVYFGLLYLLKFEELNVLGDLVRRVLPGAK
ncbi:MAG: murein biosynthesis integral membrane protein MurJ [Coraliomargarita sp.]